ncbi:hypothetical protein Lal_00012223 [Lupinus albus]|nr:hypothetical protein Lal_00012223 [Lupinus albus]
MAKFKRIGSRNTKFFHMITEIRQAHSLAKFPFKIITKVLADRLTSIATRIVSPNQRGFIKDRHIHHCKCIASEATNLLEHKAFGGNLAINLHIKKAFDTMGLSFYA